MTLIEIILLLSIIGISVLYYLKFEYKKKAEEYFRIADENKKIYRNLMVEYKKIIEDHKETKKELESKNSYINELQKQIDSIHQINSNLSKENESFSRKIENLTKPKIVYPKVYQNDFPFILNSIISYSEIEINLSLLIDDNKLFDVFKKLHNAKLLPESVNENINLNKGNLTILIDTQKWENKNEDAYPVESLTWNEIIKSIVDKRNFLIKYLNKVIKDSNRTMEVHNALSSK